MSDGQLLASGSNGQVAFQQNIMLDNIAAADVGQWINSTGYGLGSIEVLSTAGAFSLTVMGTNASGLPINSADGSTIGVKNDAGTIATTITVPGMYNLVNLPFAFFKVKCTALSGGGNVSANSFLRT